MKINQLSHFPDDLMKTNELDAFGTMPIKMLRWRDIRDKAG